MPIIDFSQISDIEDFTPLPAGKYPCKLVEVEKSQTQYGDEMWKIRYEILSGEHAGRYLFDNMVFSEAAMKRVKLICSRLGLDVSGEINLAPEMLKGKTCYVIAEVEDYEDQEGKMKKRNVVPFAGYERMDGTTDENLSEENTPF